MSPWTTAFYLALTSSLVLYVYRFAAFGVNLSVFRVLLLAWTLVFAADLARGRRRLERRHWPFVAIAAAIGLICTADFLRLPQYPILRRDLANHLANLVFAGLVLVYIDTREKVAALLRAFVASSVVTTAVTLYSGYTGAIPFEAWIRRAGSEMGRTLTYLNDDSVFARATSTFFDPNFYGIYSMLVVASIVYLWRCDRPSRWLGALFAVNLVCLTLTLSRTAVIGVLAVFALTFLLSRESRRFAVASAVATVALLYASTAFQSYDAYERLTAQAQAAWSAVTSRPPGDAAAGRPGARPRRARDRAGQGVQDRVASARSLETRLEFIGRGLAVFRAHPVFGGGSAPLTTAEVPWATAHLTYLTLLARYGIVGAAVYAAFLLTPLVLAWRPGGARAPRMLVTLAVVPLLVVYLSYDVFMFFEIQYLFFGLAYAAALGGFLGPERPATAGAA
ncbi:MAG: O-antigen ligase family protein [Vicinamibacterales bacterium]